MTDGDRLEWREGDVKISRPSQDEAVPLEGARTAVSLKESGEAAAGPSETEPAPPGDEAAGERVGETMLDRLSRGECPVCGGAVREQCRCFRADATCVNGHKWHYCPQHRDSLVIGFHSDHSKKDCTCQASSSGDGGPEEQVKAVRKGGRWVTMPANGEGGGGTPVYVDDSGEITAGPEGLAGKRPGQLRSGDKKPAPGDSGGGKPEKPSAAPAKTRQVSSAAGPVDVPSYDASSFDASFSLPSERAVWDGVADEVKRHAASREGRVLGLPPTIAQLYRAAKKASPDLSLGEFHSQLGAWEKRGILTLQRNVDSSRTPKEATEQSMHVSGGTPQASGLKTWAVVRGEYKPPPG